MFLGLTIYAWITVLTVLAVFTVMLATKLPADLVFTGAMAVLYLSGTLSLQETFQGFSSSTVLTVGFLFVLIAGLTYTGVLQWVVEHLMGMPKSYPRAIARLMATVAALSAFLSNTTVVALFVNVVRKWSAKLGITPSKLLIPLSYAAGMGGICTIIGTPPNLVISEMLADSTGTQLGFFSTTLPGLFCLAIGILATLAMRRLLPDRVRNQNSFEEPSNYTVEMLVPADSSLVGRTVSQIGLDKVRAGHLISIVRFDKLIVNDNLADEFIYGNDRLVFAGDIVRLLELRDRLKLVNTDRHVFHFSEAARGNMVMAYIVHRSRYIDTCVSENDLEAQFDCQVVAIAREGVTILQSPRDTKLQPGDLLLIQTSRKTDMNRLSDLFNIVDDQFKFTTGPRTIHAALILLAMVLLSTFGVLTVLQSSIVAAFLTLIFRCCTINQARREIDWSILMVFAGSITLGAAIEKTGLGVILSDAILSATGTSALMALILICFVGTFITEFTSNTAAAAILFPIALNTATALGANPVTFSIALMIAVSSSFATPIGSPTHMLVYGPGGYRFSDFARIGLPMNFIILAADIFITTLLFPL